MAVLKVGLVQLNTRSAREANLAEIERLVGEAAERGARFIMLPEYAPYLGPKEGYQEGAERIPGSLTDRFAALARRQNIYLHAGSMVEQTETPGKFGNTSIVFNPSGDIIAKYRKIQKNRTEVPSLANRQSAVYTLEARGAAVLR